MNRPSAQDAVGTTRASISPFRAWYVVGVFMLAYLVAIIDRVVITLMVEPIKSDLAISDTQFSLLSGLAFAIFYSTAAIPIARLADRSSRRRIIALGVLGWSVMTAVCGLARNFGQLFVARVGVGVGEAALYPAAVSSLADLFPRHKLSRALAVLTMGATIGSGVAYLAGGAVIRFVSEAGPMTWPVVGTVSSWQAVFFIVALPGLFVAALVYTTPEPQRTQAASAPSDRAGLIAHLRANAKAYAHYLAGNSIFVAIFHALITWLPTLLTRHHGATMAEAGTALGLVVILAGPLGMICSGALADHWTRRNRLDAQLRVSAIGSAALTVFIVAMPLVTIWGVAVTLLVPLYFFVSFTSAIGNAGVQALTPPHLRAQLAAIYLFLANLFGSTAGPALVAVLTDYVFRDPAKIHLSLACVGGGLCATAVVVFVTGARAFRESAGRQIAN